MYYTPPPFFPKYNWQNFCYKHVIYAEWKTVWILVSWLLASQKPAGMEPYCFQNIRFSMVRDLAILRLSLYSTVDTFNSHPTPICSQLSEKFQVISCHSLIMYSTVTSVFFHPVTIPFPNLPHPLIQKVLVEGVQL